MLDAMVWSVGEVEGLEHEDVDPPDVPDPRRRCPTWADLRPDERSSAHALLGELRPATDRAGRASGRRRSRCRRRGAPGSVHVRRRPSTDPWVDAARLAHRARRGELAGGLAPAHVSRAAVHRTEPRPLRVLPVPRDRVGLAPARRAFAGGPRRPAVVDGEGLVAASGGSSPAAGARRSSDTPETGAQSAV